MSSITRKDQILAVTLTGLVTAALWQTLYAPLIEQKESVQRQTDELQATIAEIETAINLVRAESIRTKDELIQALKNGYVSKMSSHAAADDQLQKIVKHAARQADASIVQIRPLAAEQASILKRAKLTVNLRIKSAQIDTLLDVLARSLPRLSVETMVLRQTPQAGSGDQLEGNMTVALWYSGEQITNANTLETTPIQILTRNNDSMPSFTPIDTLFEPELRSRMLNPTLDPYRLTAITASSNARIAVITDRQTNQSRRLRVGDYLDTWKIIEIHSDRVSLRGKESLKSLSLNVPSDR